jgi:F-type H+-transporting ATPase subunit b
MAVVLMLAVGAAWGASEGGGHGAEAGAEDHGIHWQATDWARVLNFVVLVVALFIVLRKPVGSALNNRISVIKEELEDLESRKVDVEKQLASYNEKLKQMDKEAEQIIAQYVQQGEDAKARILKEAQTAAEKLKEQAKKNIAHEFNQAKLQLQVEIVEKALAKAEKIIAEQITDEDQGRLVDEYLDKVVA